jgi:hypothetical protein
MLFYLYAHLAHDVADKGVLHTHDASGPLDRLASLEVELAIVELAGDAGPPSLVGDFACGGHSSPTIF